MGIVFEKNEANTPTLQKRLVEGKHVATVYWSLLRFQYLSMILNRNENGGKQAWHCTL